MIRETPPTIRLTINVNCDRGSDESHNRARRASGGSAVEKKRRRFDSGESCWKNSCSAARSPGSERRMNAVDPSRRMRRPDSAESW